MSLETDLEQFTGTTKYFNEPTLDLRFTEGVDYLVNACFDVAFMIHDIVATLNRLHLSNENYVGVIIKSQNKSATVELNDGNYNVYHVLKYASTELENGTYKLFYCGNDGYLGNVLALLSEY